MLINTIIIFIILQIIQYRNNQLIKTLEKDKLEYCRVINDLEWYAPDSIKYQHRFVIDFAKLQCENNK